MNDPEQDARAAMTAVRVSWRESAIALGTLLEALGRLAAVDKFQAQVIAAELTSQPVEAEMLKAGWTLRDPSFGAGMVWPLVIPAMDAPGKREASVNTTWATDNASRTEHETR